MFHNVNATLSMLKNATPCRCIKYCGTVYAKECKSVRRSTILNNECRQVPSLGDSGVQEHLYIIAMKRCS